MDERFDQLAKGLASPTDASSSKGQGPSLGDLKEVFGDPVTDDTVTEDAILYAKVMCHDQKKRGGSLRGAKPSSTCGTSGLGGTTSTAPARRR